MCVRLISVRIQTEDVSRKVAINVSISVAASLPLCHSTLLLAMIWPDTDTPEFIRTAVEQVGEVSARILSMAGQLSGLGGWEYDIRPSVNGWHS